MADKIIIFSGKQYAGKDTAAKIMLKHMEEYRRCAIGDIIKIEYGKRHNLTYAEIEENKSKYRAGLIELGNRGRGISKDYWLNKIVLSGGNIMVTDVRVPYEYEFFKSSGAISIRIEADREVRAKRGKLVGEDDITEVGLDDITDWDYVITNNGNLADFEGKCLKIAELLE